MIAFLLLVAAIGLSANRVIWLFTEGAAEKHYSTETSVATSVALGAAALSFHDLGFGGGACASIFGLALSVLFANVEPNYLTTGLGAICLLTYLAAGSH